MSREGCDDLVNDSLWRSNVVIFIQTNREAQCCSTVESFLSKSDNSLEHACFSCFDKLLVSMFFWFSSRDFHVFLLRAFRVGI